MKISVFLLLSFLFISDCLFSQFKLPIEYRFSGGEDGYSSFFSKNIKISDNEVKNGVFGNSITKISVNPEGKIYGITIINSIDSIVDNEIIRIIRLSDDQWKKSDTISYNQSFYIQVGIARPDFLPNFFRPKSSIFRRLFPKPIIITSGGDFKIPFLKSSELSEKANINLDKEKFEEALPLISELIKRDPFNRDLYKTRIMINIRLNRPELVEADDNRIFNFAEGYSLDDLFKDQGK